MKLVAYGDRFWIMVEATWHGRRVADLFLWLSTRIKAELIVTKISTVEFLL